MNKAKRGKYVTIRSLLAKIKDSREYENILKVVRSQSKIDQASEKTIEFTKSAEIALAVKIRNAVIKILKRRMNRSRNKDLEMEKFLKSLEKWVGIILPAYKFSMEYWRQEFEQQFYLDQATDF